MERRKIEKPTERRGAGWRAQWVLARIEEKPGLTLRAIQADFVARYIGAGC